MIIIDGYNVIYKWKSLEKFIENLDLARTKLIDIMSNYQGYTGEEVLIVFDSKLEEKPDSQFYPENVKVVFAKEKLGADAFIERLVFSNEKPQSITVVTGDSLFRMTVSHKGVYAIRPLQFEKEVLRVCKKGRNAL